MALKLYNHRNNMYYLPFDVVNEVRIFIKAKRVCQNMIFRVTSNKNINFLLSTYIYIIYNQLYIFMLYILYV